MGTSDTGEPFGRTAHEFLGRWWHSDGRHVPNIDRQYKINYGPENGDPPEKLSRRPGLSGMYTL